MNISKENQIKKAYIYPMANATNGGESHSEYNIRNSLLNLLSYSAAFSMNDFKIIHASHDFPINLDKTTEAESNNIGASESNIIDLHLAISAGRGNCNGYLVECENFGSYADDGYSVSDGTIEVKDIDLSNYKDYLPTYKNKILNCQFDLGLYLCVNYSNGIADGLSYKLIQNRVHDIEPSVDIEDLDTEYDLVFAEYYKPYGFNDIGILIGNMTVQYQDGSYVVVQELHDNENKTRCIDLDRLGDQNGLVEQLSNLIDRLQRLNIFGGSFYVSDTLVPQGKVIADVGSDGARSIYGGDYRLKLYSNIEKIKENNEYTGKYKIFGGLSLVDVPAGEGADTEINKILTFSTTEFDLSDGLNSENSITKFIVEIPKANIDSATIKALRAHNFITDTIHINKSYIEFGDSTFIDGAGNSVSFSKPIYAREITGKKVYGAVWQ